MNIFFIDVFPVKILNYNSNMGVTNHPSDDIKSIPFDFVVIYKWVCSTIVRLLF